MEVALHHHALQYEAASASTAVELERILAAGALFAVLDKKRCKHSKHFGFLQANALKKKPNTDFLQNCAAEQRNSIFEEETSIQASLPARARPSETKRPNLELKMYLKNLS